MTAGGVVSKEAADQDSGAIEIPEQRRKFRETRATDVRIGILETKSDDHTEAIGDLRTEVAEMGGRLGGQLSTLLDIAERQDASKTAQLNAESMLKAVEINAQAARAKAIIDAEDKRIAAEAIRRVRRGAWWIAFFKVLVSIITAVGIAAAAYKAAK